MIQSFYEMLGVAKTASPEEIKRAYRRRAGSLHPDKGGDAAMMAELNRAYACLSNPEDRARYDATGEEPSGRSIDTEARNVLLNQFDLVLKSNPNDYVEAVRNGILNQLRDIRNEIATAENIVIAITHRRDKIKLKKKRKKGVPNNLWHQLIDHQLGQLRTKIADGKAAAEAREHALKMLDDYESEIVVSLFMSTGTSYTFTTTTS